MEPLAGGGDRVRAGDDASAVKMSPRSFALVRGGVGRERSAGLARVEASNNLFLSRNWEKGEKFTIILILPG